MELRVIIVGYTVFVLLLTSLFASSIITDIPIHSQSIKPVYRGLSIVFESSYSSIILIDYKVYDIRNIDPQFKHLFIIKHLMKKESYGPLNIEDIRLNINSTHEIKPILPPKSLMFFDEYILYLDKVNPLDLGIVSGNKTIRLNISGDYLLILILYYIRQDTIIDLSKYIPPITYYPPNPPPEPAPLYEYVKKAFNDPYYAMMIKYLFNELVDSTNSVEVFIQYYLSRDKFNFLSLMGLWGLLIVFMSMYDIYLIPRIAKLLFYKLKLSLHYTEQALIKLKRYIVGQHSALSRKET